MNAFQHVDAVLQRLTSGQGSRARTPAARKPGTRSSLLCCGLTSRTDARCAGGQCGVSMSAGDASSAAAVAAAAACAVPDHAVPNTQHKRQPRSLRRAVTQLKGCSATQTVFESISGEPSGQHASICGSGLVPAWERRRSRWRQAVISADAPNVSNSPFFALPHHCKHTRLCRPDSDTRKQQRNRTGALRGRPASSPSSIIELRECCIRVRAAGRRPVSASASASACRPPLPPPPQQDRAAGDRLFPSDTCTPAACSLQPQTLMLADSFRQQQ